MFGSFTEKVKLPDFRLENPFLLKWKTRIIHIRENLKMSNLALAHSVKVPRLYKTAAKLVTRVNNGENLRTLISKVNHPNKRGIMGLVTKTLQHNRVLNKLFENTDLLKKEDRIDADLASVLVTELIWGKKVLQGDSKPVQTILKYQERLLASVPVDDLTLTDECIQTTWRPRYVRVNRIKTTPEAIKNYFTKRLWKTLKPPETYEEYIEFMKKNLTEANFCQDYHLEDLFLFPFGTVFAENPLYKSGSLILQDKASCMAARVLAPELGSTVLDMCAAPGMKTTYLAAMMKNQGKIYAVEQNQNRFVTLKKTIAQHGASKCVTPVKGDVLGAKIRREDINYILLDPSCSGTGILNRPSYTEKDTNDESLRERLNSLAKLQTKLLRFALTQFPFAKRVVYSTCSVHAEENEEVVERVLKNNLHYELVDCSKIFKGWFNFGLSRYTCGAKCIRAVPESDCTNGFFIAAFERKVKADKEEEV